VKICGTLLDTEVNFTIFTQYFQLVTAGSCGLCRLYC